VEVRSSVRGPSKETHSYREEDTLISLQGLLLSLCEEASSVFSRFLRHVWP